MASLLQQILALLYPPKCAGCGAVDTHFCQSCQLQIQHISQPLCQKCGYPLQHASTACRQCQTHTISHLDTIRSVAFFESATLRKAIHRFKYQNHRALGENFALMLASCYDESKQNTQVIIPVPLHKSRYKERGYNQSAILAYSLSKLIDQPVNSKALIRQRSTQTQMSLGSDERQQNVKQAFVCTSKELANKSVLLIDDVVTTGATLNECALALKDADVLVVHALTLARAK